MEFTFKPGDRVCWVNGVFDPAQRNVPGTVLEVLEDEVDVAEFTLYKIEFPFGTFTVYGAQLESAQK